MAPSDTRAAGLKTVQGPSTDSNWHRDQPQLVVILDPAYLDRVRGGNTQRGPADAGLEQIHKAADLMGLPVGLAVPTNSAGTDFELMRLGHYGRGDNQGGQITWPDAHGMGIATVVVKVLSRQWDREVPAFHTKAIGSNVPVLAGDGAGLEVTLGERIAGHDSALTYYAGPALREANTVRVTSPRIPSLIRKTNSLYVARVAYAAGEGDRGLAEERPVPSSKDERAMAAALNSDDRAHELATTAREAYAVEHEGVSRGARLGLDGPGRSGASLTQRDFGLYG